MIEELKRKNLELIVKYKNDKKQLDEQLLIKNILKEDNCFFKISINDAFNIMNSLEILDSEKCYSSLINYTNYCIY